MSRIEIRRPALLLTTGGIGGYLASLLGVPMPWMLGSLAAVACLAMSPVPMMQASYRFPELIRRGFVALIGVMIGAGFSPEVLDGIGSLWISLIAVVAFVMINHFANFHICQRIGGFDRKTAFYAATPGGLVESIELGTAAGGDGARISLQHFSRIILVVTTIPLFLSLWTGQSVGSAAGMSLSAVSWNMRFLLEIALLCLVGYGVGRILRLPAYFLVGPLIVSAAAHAFGLTEAQAPPIVGSVAQVVLGASLGVGFTGLALRDLGIAFKVGVATVGFMLVLASVFSVILIQLIPQSFEVMLITLAPGGVIEMSLIALSLHANPVFVTAHHIFRISMTVFTLVLARKVVLRDR